MLMIHYIIPKRKLMMCMNFILGGLDLIEALKEDETLKGNKDVMFGLEQMQLTLKYCELFGILDKVNFVKYYQICVIVCIFDV